MGAMGMAFAQIGMSAIGAMGQMSQARATSNAAIEQSRLEWQEYERQKVEATRQAQEQKSERAREADRKMGMMLAVMADNGAEGTSTVSRYAGEIGFLEGLDIARIEGNRRRELAALGSKQYASGVRALGTINAAGAQAQQAIWGVAKTAAGAALKFGENAPEKGVTKSTPGWYGTGNRLSGTNPHTGKLIKSSSGMLAGGV